MIETRILGFTVKWLMVIKGYDEFDRFMSLIERGKERPFYATKLLGRVKIDTVNTSSTSDVATFSSIMLNGGIVFFLTSFVATPSDEEISFTAAGRVSVSYTLGSAVLTTIIPFLITYFAFPFTVGPEGPSLRKRTVRNENTGRIRSISGGNG